MKSVHIRDFDEAVLRKLLYGAHIHHRSLQGELRVILPWTPSPSQVVSTHVAELPTARIVDDLLQAFTAYPDVHTVVLFGSAARDKMVDHGELRSDIDVGLAANPSFTLEHRLLIASDLEERTGRQVDIVDLAHAHGLILREALTKGIILKRSPEFPYRKMLEMYDDEVTLRPLLERARRERLATAFPKTSEKKR